MEDVVAGCVALADARRVVEVTAAGRLIKIDTLTLGVGQAAGQTVLKFAPSAHLATSSDEVVEPSLDHLVQRS